MSDEVLVAKAQEGDRESLNELVSTYWQPIYQLVCYKVQNSEDAKEITQETFLRAFRSLPRYRPGEASFKTYLGRIALNLVTDHWRKKGRTPPFIDLAEYNEPIADSAELPEDQTVSADEHRRMLALLEMLPPDQRRAIELRILEGMPVREAAQSMGRTEPALKMLQQRRFGL